MTENGQLGSQNIPNSKISITDHILKKLLCIKFNSPSSNALRLFYDGSFNIDLGTILPFLVSPCHDDAFACISYDPLRSSHLFTLSQVTDPISPGNFEGIGSFNLMPHASGKITSFTTHR